MYRSHVLVCGGTGCTSSGSQQIIDTFEAEIKKNGLEEEVAVVRTGCHGLCALGPIVLVYPEGSFYSMVNKEDVAEIVSEHLLKGRVVTRLLYQETVKEDEIIPLAETGFYKKQERIALRNCGVINPEVIDEYIAVEGYQALGKVLTEMTPDDVIQTILDSGLRGRGGGGFPTGLKWKFASGNRGNVVKYIGCNADEGDPGAFMDRSVLEGDPHALIEAMTIGRKGEISKATRTAYARAGISHVLALSGFHVGIIAMMMQFFFLKKMLPRRWQWVSNTLIIAALWCYALMTGMSPSLVRAVIMFSLLLLSQMLSRENITLNSCALAFFLMLCINPFLLHDIGFQLSFISVCSISLFNKQLIRTCPSRSPFILTLWTTIGITFICSLFTAPLVAHHFGNIPILSIISNLAILPFVYLLMWGSILWWAFLWSPSINAVLTELLNWTATTMNSITETIATLPFSTIEWHPDALVTILCYTALLILTLGLQKYSPTTQSPINNNIFSHIRRHIHKK